VGGRWNDGHCNIKKLDTERHFSMPKSVMLLSSAEANVSTVEFGKLSICFNFQS